MPSTSNSAANRWHRYHTVTELEAAAVQAIRLGAHQAIIQRGRFDIVLSGGTTPRRIYQAMRSADTDWSSWHVYFGDERCLPVEHSERNSRMAAQAWLDHVAIPRAQIHPIPAEQGPEAAAADYSGTLDGIERFDLVLLGLGEDGHTASLFPGHELGNTPAAPAALAVHDAPKPPPERVSLSANRLGAARRVIFLVAGESKRQAVTDWRNGANIPAAAVTPIGGADVYLEAGLLAGSSKP
ncbi:MAG: 6-phosphogluconolactonase [Gallionella sp.]